VGRQHRNNQNSGLTGVSVGDATLKGFDKPVALYEVRAG
jgi:hypothetical protein